MLISMTGFGRSEFSLPGFGRAAAEIRALNHRFLEVEFRLPEGYDFLEAEIRQIISREIRRGRVRVSVSVKRIFDRPPASFRADVARQYAKSLRGLARQLGLQGDLTLSTILGLPQVVVASNGEAPTQKAVQALKAGIGRALWQASRMRQQEGGRLEKEIRRIVGRLESFRSQVMRRKKISEKTATERISQRLQELLAQAVDERRLVAEAASLVQQSDVSEEFARIASHLSALKKAMTSPGESPGRTIDFLAQELHREVNTLGTKARDGLITQQVVAMKNQIEKLREQASNIE